MMLLSCGLSIFKLPIYNQNYTAFYFNKKIGNVITVDEKNSNLNLMLNDLQFDIN